MNVLITGTSSGIGRAIAIKFLKEFSVIGFDKQPSTIDDKHYQHFKIDIAKDNLPKLDDIFYLIHCAGSYKEEECIDVNLKGTIKVNEKYGINNSSIKSILFVASASATSGAEFPKYCASKGGILSYMKNVAIEVSRYGATCNSLSPGGVITNSNNHILNNDKLYKDVLNETILNKWASEDEIADFAYFMTVINKSMTGQDVIVDNGEIIKSNFIW